MMVTKPTLLIVDNEVHNLEVMVEILEQSPVSYRILRANSGETGLHLARHRLPDLVITDWDMPNMNGLELVRALKADPLTSLIPVIMCSGVMTRSENLQQALEAGAVDYVRKPVDPLELQARVHSMLELSRSYQEIRRLSARKDEMFATVSHSLLTSVGNLHTMLGLLREIWSHEHEQAVALIQQSNTKAQQALELLKNLLAWSRCYFEAYPYQPQTVNLLALVQSLIAELSDLSAERKVLIETHISSELKVLADVDMLQQILRQLIVNGLNFTPPNQKVTIQAELYPAKDEFDQDGQVEYFAPSVWIQVRDTGCGMPADLIKRLNQDGSIFLPGPTGSHQTAGIGLKIVTELLARHHSRLELDSASEQGTYASFVLPRAKKGAA